MKLFDFAHFARSSAFVIMDADVLFFRPPCSTLQARLGREGSASNLFLRDYQASCSLETEELERLCGRTLESVNTGLALIRRSMIDPPVIESYLTRAPEVLNNLSWAERTLYALASAPNGISLLPPQYQVARGRGLDGVIMKHCVGPVREYFYVEGLPAAHRALLHQVAT